RFAVLGSRFIGSRFSFGGSCSVVPVLGRRWIFACAGQNQYTEPENAEPENPEPRTRTENPNREPEPRTRTENQNREPRTPNPEPVLASASRFLVHVPRERLHVLDWRGRQNAVAEVEDVTRSAAGAVEDVVGCSKDAIERA